MIISICINEVTMNRQEILDKITNYYLTSGDFNGIANKNIGYNSLHDLEELILEDKIFVLSQRDDINIFIHRFDKIPSKEKQLNALQNESLVALYPTKEHLATVNIVEEKPFTKMLAQGVEQLRILYFNVDILQMYYDNPLYRILDFGYRGRIDVVDPDADELHSEYIEDFGVAYPSKNPIDSDRAIGVFLRDLSKLNYEAQCKWRGCLLRDQNEFVINKGFVDNLICCKWVKEVWVFDALLEELKFINILCKNIGLPPLFSKEYDMNENALIGYRILLIPSKKNYYEFVTALEKIVVNNINYKFFEFDKLHYILPIERKKEDGSLKGSLALLEEWMDTNYFSSNPQGQQAFKEYIMSTLREIRKIRQTPAHEMYSNQHDKSLYCKQNELINETYQSINQLRFIFQCHPANKNVVTPNKLADERNIVLY